MSLIRNTGTNARRRRELLHQQVDKVAASCADSSRQNNGRPVKLSLGQWLALELDGLHDCSNVLAKCTLLCSPPERILNFLSIKSPIAASFIALEKASSKF